MNKSLPKTGTLTSIGAKAGDVVARIDARDQSGYAITPHEIDVDDRDGFYIVKVK